MNDCTTTTPITVTIPKVATLKSTYVCNLAIYALPEASRKAYVLPGLAQYSLLSVGILVDHGCTLIFQHN